MSNQMKTARTNAGQSQIQAAVEIGVSQGVIVNMEKEPPIWPKKPLHIQAMRKYIKKYGGDK